MWQCGGKKSRKCSWQEFRDSQLSLLKWHWIKNSKKAVASFLIERLKKMLGHHYPVNTAGRKPPKTVCNVSCLFFFFFCLQTKRFVLAPERRQINTLPTYPGGCEPLSGRQTPMALHPTPALPICSGTKLCLCAGWTGPPSPRLHTLVSRPWTDSASVSDGQKWGSGWEQSETVITLQASISHSPIFIRN